MNLLMMSLTGGVFIAVTLLLRALFQHIVPRRTFLLLWIAANVLLLLPIRVPTPVSIYHLMAVPSAGTGTQALTAQMAVTAAQAVPAVTQAAAPLSLYPLIWLLGATVLLGCALFVHGKNLWQFRFAIPVEERPAELPGWVRVKRLDGLITPLTYGVLRPTILLPAGDSLREEQLRHIYLHELCHIRHFDVLRKYILLLTLAIHWFNPLVWVMTYAVMQDMEMRCDAQVVHTLGAKKAYANTLVQMETGKMQRILEAGFSFSATNSRLKALIKLRKRSALSIALALVLCVTTTVVFATDAKSLPTEAPAPVLPAPQEEPVLPPPTEPEEPKPEKAPIVIPEEPEAPAEILPEPEETPEEKEPTEEKAPIEPEPPEEKPEEPKPEPQEPETEEYPEEPRPVGTLPTEAPSPAYLGEIHLTCGATWSYSFAADRPYITGVNDYTGLNHAIGSYSNGLQTVTVIAGAPGSYSVWVAPSDSGYPESYLLTLIVTEGENEE